MNFAEYLRFEREAEERHELIEGETVAMAGATVRHNLLPHRSHEQDDREEAPRSRAGGLFQIAALDEYVIASHARRELEVWTRGESGWTRRLATEGVVSLVCGATIDVSRLYDSLPD